MSENIKPKKRRFLRAELTVLVCLICIIVSAMIIYDIDSVKASVLKQVVKIDPENANAHLFLGDYYADLYHYEAAILSLKETIRTNPDDAVTYSKLGDVYCYLGYNEEAIEAYREAIRIDPDDADAHLNLGHACYNAYGDDANYPEEAIESYKEAIRLNPNCYDAHFNLGYFYYESGHYAEAVEHLKEAVRIEPHSFYYDRLGLISALHSAIGDAYSALGRYEDALEACRQAINIKPDNAEAHYKLAKVYLKTGDKDLAWEEYEILKSWDEELAKKLFDLLQQ